MTPLSATEASPGSPLLTSARAAVAANIWVVLTVMAAAWIFWTKPDMQAGRDFGVLWLAARLAWDGQIGALYGDAEQAMVAAMFGAGNAGPFYYPPVALFLWVPFGFLPFVPAAITWVCATGATFAVAVRAMAGPGKILATLAWPGTIVCALYGQNGLLLASLMGGAAVTLDRYPTLAGMFIGCMIYKPHVAVLAPLALGLTGRWRAFVAAGVTAIVLVAGSVLAFGVESWTVFIADLPAAKAWYANGTPGFGKFASPYTSLRLLGASADLAWAAQSVIALAAVGVLVWAARRLTEGRAVIAVMAAATGFCVPFLGEYDLPILAIPGAWLIAEARRTGWRSYELPAMAILYLSPALITFAADLRIPLAPLAMMLLLVLVVLRVPNQRQVTPA